MALSKVLSIAISIVFFVHAASGIYVTFDIHREVFSLVTLLFLVVSCACTLVYQLLMIFQIVQKLQAMNVSYWLPVSSAAAGTILVSKGISFALVFYITGLHLDAVGVEANFIYAFHTDLGTVSKVCNLLGNLVFDTYKLYAIANYYRFIEINIVRSLKVEIVIEKEQDKTKVKEIIRALYILLVACVVFSIMALVFAILGFEVVQHSVGVAMDSTTAVLMLVLNIWLDKNFMLAIAVHHKLSSAAGSSRKSATASTTGAKDENTALLVMAGVIPKQEAPQTPKRAQSVSRRPSNSVSKPSGGARASLVRRQSSILATAAVNEKTTFMNDQDSKIEEGDH
ncbi:hypothetical protein BDR26DRAFT_861510 [Obelidium mucronatum]|nr:hypothetical protein BDR26DRAFT_861510 [Obelidium mucronatum]